MSTNYYLVNRKELDIKKELNKLIVVELEILKNKLLEFNTKYDLDIEEGIDSKISITHNNLCYGIFEPEVIHICKTNAQTLTWQICDNYTTKDDFIDYYNMDGIKEKYEIQNEYDEVFTFEELMDKIHWEGQEIKYIMWEFS